MGLADAAERMSRDHRLRLLACLTVAFWTAVFLQAPIPQDPAYHGFADQRPLLGIPHCLNVISNLPFLLVGLWGLCRLADPRRHAFLGAADALAYQILFLSVALVGLGSAWYHLDPGNGTLLWDRLPMSAAFMAFLAAAIAERVDRRAGLLSLPPLIAFGLFSVLYWHFTEEAGAGDLRYYIVAQAYPVVFVPLMVRLLPSPYTRGSDLYAAALIYVLAKGAEMLDPAVYAAGGWISGHTCKHLLGALGAWWVLRMVQRRRLVEQPPGGSGMDAGGWGGRVG